ncbi:Hypothetical predicted protein [Octopus vulgaris]|uniref:Uncharacterized protein n=1 Tax=Octopus vulgaris TaxID=6645 RepID=A0AA36F6H9_OCTVU|nr:Hypothetical predicted protein [Octopus vulgaris]
MVGQFEDVIAVNIPNWYSNPFEVDAVCEDDVQEELIELQNDNDATMRYCCNGKEGYILCGHDDDVAVNFRC